MEIKQTICQMCSCSESACALDVYLDDGKIVKIKGTKDGLTSEGRLCAKALAARELEYEPRRLVHPLKRIGKRGGGEWEQISWDEALHTIASSLGELRQQYGPEALYFHRGQGPGWEAPKAFAQRFMSAYGSPNYGSSAYLCHAPIAIANVCTYGAKPLPDWEHTKCMVLWGRNPVETSLGNHGHRVIEAKQRGAQLIVIDPRFSRTASKADLWVQPRPGTDGALALAMANVIIEEGLHDREFIGKWTSGFEPFAELARQYPPEKAQEITWVPADKIRAVARAYATNRPAILDDGNGLDMHTNVVQTSRALCILRVITGNLDLPGTYVFDPEGGSRKKTRDLSLRPASWPEVEKLFSRSVSKHIFQFKQHGCGTLDAVNSLERGEPYRIRAMIVQGGDPLISLSHQSRVKEAFQKLDFLVVHDIFMTHSAEIADIVLPATTFLERTRLIDFSFSASPRLDTKYLGLQDKVVEPPGECKSDINFLCELGRRLGHEEQFPWTNEENAINFELEPVGLTVAELRARGGIVGRKLDPERLYGKWPEFCSGLPTKRIELYSKLFEQRGLDPLPTYHEPGESPISRPDLVKDYPMVGQVGIKPGIFTHAQYRTLPSLKKIMSEPWADLNPEKAKELGIQDGDLVTVESPRGSIEIQARVTDSVDPRVVFVTHGWGQAYAHGANANVLTPDESVCPVSGATGNRSFLCRVRKS